MEFSLMSSNKLSNSGNVLIGSTGFPDKEMPSSVISDDNLKPIKIAKLSNAFSDGQQQQSLFSFSSPKYSTFPFFQYPNSFHSNNAGYSCNGSLNASMCLSNGLRAPFTPSQWFELEQQALIYKYILAQVPIPPNLLIPIRRAFELAGFSSFSGGLLRPNTFGWGPFHLSYANSADPEPGRCRRTDGKKWRCSRDAVPGQKYCERHMNRGRHRSRKPVEGHPGHSISGITTGSSTTNAMNSASSCALVVPGGGTSNSFAVNLNQSKDIQPDPPNHLPSSVFNRNMVNKANKSQGMQGAIGLDFQYPKSSLNSSGNTFSITESAAGDFAYLTSDAILNTTHMGMGCSVSRSYGPGPTHDLNVQRSNPQHSNHSFMDNQSTILWSKLQTQADRSTQLSISIPPADYTSSTSSPTGEKVALSPIRLSRELDTVPNERRPGSWETSLGGPLGEVLKTTTNNSSESMMPLNLLSKKWDGKIGNTQSASSPTGVLGYFSNSSAGSSPKAETSTISGELIGFNLGSSSSLPIF